MGSRMRENPDKVFELFTEIGKPSGVGQDPFVLQQYPLDYGDEEVLKSIPKFAFPCESDSNAVDHFTFVLTDIDGKFKYGFCRHGTTGAQTCLLIISYFPWFEVFYKLLNHIAEVLNHSEDNNVESLLERIYELSAPQLQPLSEVEVVTPNLKDSFSFFPPDPMQLPSIPDGRNLTEYYNAIDTNNMMVIFASMLFERRILVMSRKLSRVTACVHGSASLIYPMHWQHLYIPILPPHLIDYVSAPMPYLIGIHSSLMDEATNKQELGDAVILDCDTNTIKTEHDDLGSMPQEIVSTLKKRLKALQSQSEKMRLMGDGLSRVFLKALVASIGGYRDALKFRPGERITFDPEAFVHSRPSSMQPFLEEMLHLQIFEQFINDRLELLNSGQGFSDEFEIEINMTADKTGSQSMYKEWLTSAKKQGKKLRREGKDKWVEFTSKANPAVRHAVQTVKDKSKKAYKDLRSKLDEAKREGEVASLHGRPPTTIPVTDLRRHRTARAAGKSDTPPRPPPPSMILRNSRNSINSQLHRTTYERDLEDENLLKLYKGDDENEAFLLSRFSSRQYKILDLEDLNAEDAVGARATRRISSDDTEVEMTYDRVSVGLMDDPDIQQVFKRSFSLEDVSRLQEEDEEMAFDALEYNFDSHSPSSRSKSSTPSRSPTPAARPRPSTPAGSSVHSTDSGDAAIPRPVAPPRAKHKETLGGKGLISLDSLAGSKQNLPRHKLETLPTEYKRLSSEFDPLENEAKTASQSDVSTSSGEFVQSEQPQSLGDQSSDASGEGLSRNRPSVTRHNAFYKIQKPPSIKRRSPQPQAMDAQNISRARTAFIEAEVTKPTMTNELDMFDPLQTGQLAVDARSTEDTAIGRPEGTKQKKLNSPEENLLKEWNLDFGKMNLSASGGKSPEKPPVLPRPPGLSPVLSPSLQPMMPTTSAPLGLATRNLVMSAQPYVSQRQSAPHAFIPHGQQYYHPKQVAHGVYGAIPYGQTRQTSFTAHPLASFTSSHPADQKPKPSTSISPSVGEELDPFRDLVTLPISSSPVRSPAVSPAKRSPALSPANLTPSVSPTMNSPSVSPAKSCIPPGQPAISPKPNTPNWETFE